MKVIFWGVITLFILGGTFQMGNNDKSDALSLGELMPGEIHGWRAVDEDKIYDPKTIFEYIDGAGEVYAAYNFKKLCARRYVKEGNPEIIADLFDMGEPRNAFGVFSHSLEGQSVEVGQDSIYSGGLLSFWKHRFFVSLFAEEDTPDAEAALIALGKEIANAIPSEGARPGLVSFLPRENLEKNSIRYFYNHLILNYHFFVADQNILRLDKGVEAVLGTYLLEGDESKLLLVRYPDIDRAEEAYRSFVSAYMPESVKTGLVQTENKKWTAAQVEQKLLIIIFDAPAAELAQETLATVKDST